LGGDAQQARSSPAPSTANEFSRYPPGVLLFDQLVFPWINDFVLGRAMDPVRAEVVGGARGHVLEIGAGTGLNARHYPNDAKVSAIEPSAGMRRRAEARLRDPAVRAAIRTINGRAEELPFDAGSFDAVVLTFVLCSVKDLTRTLAEVRRVLAPGGTLRLVEHVKSPDPRTASLQTRLRPLWMAVLGGCDPTREIARDLDRAGFDTSGLRAIDLPLPRLARAGVIGEAIRP
jgi:SAM-dependent methyltransferase